MLVSVTADGKKIVTLTTTGPTNYTTGGFQVTVPELQRILALNVNIKVNQKDDNTVYALDYDYSGNTITFKAYKIDVTATAPSSWSEVSAGTNLSGIVINITAIGV